MRFRPKDETVFYPALKASVACTTEGENHRGGKSRQRLARKKYKAEPKRIPRVDSPCEHGEA